MATRTRNVKPTALLFSIADRLRDFSLMVDGDLTTKGSLSALSSETIPGVLGGFDFSWLPDDATVTGISLYGYGYKGSSSSSYYGTAALVKNSTSATNNTDLGDGIKTWINSTSTKGYTVQFTNALSACTPSFLKSGALELELRARGTGIYIYELYLVVTYEVPSSVITVHAGTGGTVTGGGEYENGTTATLTATPNAGYVFKQWSDGNTSNPRTVTVTGNATYTAEFEKVTVTISASADPSEGGFVTGTGSYQYGETFTLTAVPNDGYKFVRWSTLNTTPSITRTAGLFNEDFTAYFEKEPTGNIFVGTQRVTAYCGTQKMCAYCGTKKI